MNIADTSKSEKEGDNLWLGCDTVDKSAGLCQNTLGATTVQGGFPMFTVPNLLEDSRFSDLPYVKDGPRFRFYAGTPITTKRGINIGSLCVLDSDQRPSLSESQVEVFGTLATTIMDHLESKAEARERSKVQRMSLGINAFVEGRNHLVMQHMHDAAGDRWATGEGTSKDASRRRSKRAGSSHIKRDSGPGRKGLPYLIQCNCLEKLTASQKVSFHLSEKTPYLNPHMMNQIASLMGNSPWPPAITQP